jgi:hypothetical protein
MGCVETRLARRQPPITELDLRFRLVANLQRKKSDEIIALLRREAIVSREDFVDGLAYWHLVADEKHATL